jgi:hypothetical protein
MRCIIIVAKFPTDIIIIPDTFWTSPDFSGGHYGILAIGQNKQTNKQTTTTTTTTTMDKDS